jgi:aryl-alcohol dehydrogenase-like predicted oxidoreductase
VADADARRILATALDHGIDFFETDHRTYNRNGEVFNVGETFAGPPFETGVALANRIRPFVPEGMSMAQMALRWILDFEAVGVVIPGATRGEQVAENAGVSQLPSLPRGLHEDLRQLYESEVAPHVRGPD